MKATISNLLTDEEVTVEADTADVLESKLRCRYSSALQRIPVGNLRGVIRQLNDISYISVALSGGPGDATPEDE